MRLTNVLQFYIRYRSVPGLLRYGKNRVVPPISVKAKMKMAELLVIERDNIDILNQPFLSEAEESAFRAVVPSEPFPNDRERKRIEIEAKLEALRPHYTSEQLLMHLNVYKKWE